jgi:hypothetical protein
VTIYIYRKFLNNGTARLYRDAFDQNRDNLRHHFRWFCDLLELLGRFETTDPEQADYFFVPIYTILFEFLRTDIGDLIGQCEYLHRGRHLLFVSGDYNHRARSDKETFAPQRVYPKVYDWLDGRFRLIALESTSELAPADIAIFPYQFAEDYSLNALNRPSRFRLRALGPQGVRVAAGTLLYSFCGALQYPYLPANHVRGDQGIVRLAGAGPDRFIGSAADAEKHFGRELGSYQSIISRSVFTLCPAGYGRWTFRWIEALLHGSIPVLISDGYVLPFAEYVDWDRFTIRVREQDIAAIDGIIRAITWDEIYRRQSDIIKNHRLFTRTSCREMLVRKLAASAQRHSQM